MTALALVLTVTGPFGNYSSFSFWPRLGYWAIAVGAVGLFGIGFGLYFHHHPRLRHIHPLLISLMSASVAALPGVLVIWQLEVTWRHITYAQVDLLEVAIGVFVIMLVATILRLGTWRSLLARPKPEARLSEHPFLDHLPKDLRANLISLTMRDHYIECVTLRGRKLLLMRFADALRELADYPGLQIHRSHWVAASTITGIRREGARNMATLTDGQKLPVSRTYLSAAREAIADKAPAPDDTLTRTA